MKTYRVWSKSAEGTWEYVGIFRGLDEADAIARAGRCVVDHVFGWRARERKAVAA